MYDWNRVHTQILGETFPALESAQAVALVGILSECEIRYSQELREVVEPIEGSAPLCAPLLTPEHASRLVGELFGFEPANLLARYRKEWQSLRSSPETLVTRQSLEGHRFVDELVSRPSWE